MRERDEKKARLKEIIRFGLTGGICFVVDYATMVLLKEILGVHYLVATGIGFIVSVILNYYMCVFWVFRGIDRPDKKAVSAFFVVSVVGFVLNEFFMWFFVDITGIHYTLSKIVTAALVLIWNYVAKRKVLVKEV